MLSQKNNSPAKIGPPGPIFLVHQDHIISPSLIKMVRPRNHTNQS